MFSEKEKKKSFFARKFPQRDIFIRKQGKVFYYNLTTKRQVFLLFLAVSTLSWMGSVSYHFIQNQRLRSQEKSRIQKMQSVYEGLLTEVTAFYDQIGSMVTELDEKRSLAMTGVSDETDGKESSSLTVKKIIPFENSKETVAASNIDTFLLENERLKNNVLLMQERLATLVDGRENPKKAQDVSFRKVVLQRDLATAEVEALQEKVGSLETQISNMQDTQLLVFRKMAMLADNNISTIENDLSVIRQSLAHTGLGMDSLLNRIRRNKETTGIGGPFIPATAVPHKKSPTNLNISLASLNQRLDHWYDLTTLQTVLPVGKPVDRVRVTSPFGAREDPFQDRPARHEAVDLGGMIGEPIYTTAPGKVIRAGRWGWYGNMVEIDHGFGFRTRYAHMDKVFVAKGDTVRAGDRIGTVGNTGRSTGPHLHYEIRVRGHAVDPMNFIKAGKNVFKG